MNLIAAAVLLLCCGVCVRASPTILPNPQCGCGSGSSSLSYTSKSEYFFTIAGIQNNCYPKNFCHGYNIQNLVYDRCCYERYCRHVYEEYCRYLECNTYYNQFQSIDYLYSQGSQCNSFDVILCCKDISSFSTALYYLKQKKKCLIITYGQMEGYCFRDQYKKFQYYQDYCTPYDIQFDSYSKKLQYVNLIGGYMNMEGGRQYLDSYQPYGCFNKGYDSSQFYEKYKKTFKKKEISSSGPCGTTQVTSQEYCLEYTEVSSYSSSHYSNFYDNFKKCGLPCYYNSPYITAGGSNLDIVLSQVCGYKDLCTVVYGGNSFDIFNSLTYENSYIKSLKINYQNKMLDLTAQQYVLGSGYMDTLPFLHKCFPDCFNHYSGGIPGRLPFNCYIPMRVPCGCFPYPYPSGGYGQYSSFGSSLLTSYQYESSVVNFYPYCFNDVYYSSFEYYADYFQFSTQLKKYMLQEMSYCRGQYDYIVICCEMIDYNYDNLYLDYSNQFNFKTKFLGTPYEHILPNSLPKLYPCFSGIDNIQYLLCQEDSFSWGNEFCIDTLPSYYKHCLSPCHSGPWFPSFYDNDYFNKYTNLQIFNTNIAPICPLRCNAPYYPNIGSCLYDTGYFNLGRTSSVSLAAGIDINKNVDVCIDKNIGVGKRVGLGINNNVGCGLNTGSGICNGIGHGGGHGCYPGGGRGGYLKHEEETEFEESKKESTQISHGPYGTSVNHQEEESQDYSHKEQTQAGSFGLC